MSEVNGRTCNDYARHLARHKPVRHKPTARDDDCAFCREAANREAADAARREAAKRAAADCARRWRRPTPAALAA